MFINTIFSRPALIRIALILPKTCSNLLHFEVVIATYNVVTNTIIFGDIKGLDLWGSTVITLVFRIINISIFVYDVTLAKTSPLAILCIILSNLITFSFSDFQLKLHTPLFPELLLVSPMNYLLHFEATGPEPLSYSVGHHQGNPSEVVLVWVVQVPVATPVETSLPPESIHSEPLLVSME